MRFITLDTVKVDEKGIYNIVYIDRMKFPPTTHEAMMEPTQKEICRTQIKADIKAKYTLKEAGIL